MSSVGGERGVAATELVLVTPLLLLLLVFATLAGRLAGARGNLVGAARDGAARDGAARDGARAASIQRSPDAARLAARTAAEATLADEGFQCASVVVATDVSAFRRGGTVAVDVRCDVDLSDLSPLPLPGTRTVTAGAVEVVDQFRGLEP